MELPLRPVIEALLFASPKPLTARQMVQLLPKGNLTAARPLADLQEVDETRVLDVIREIQNHLEQAASGLILQEIAGGFRYGTQPELAPWVRLLYDETKPSRLSQPALETLSIVAYRQPISRADIEAVRGVAVDGVVATLLERRMIKLAGRSDAPGKPLIYETTAEFLEAFGLKNLQELPNADELRRIPIAPVAVPAPAVPAAPVSQPEIPLAEEQGVEPSVTESPVADAALQPEAPSVPADESGDQPEESVIEASGTSPS